MLNFIENHPGFIIFLGLLAGLVLPGLSYLPQESVLIVISSVIYLACYRVKTVETASISLRSFVIFYVLRFIALPVAAFYLLSFADRNLAIAVALLYLVPAGVSTPALSAIYNGNVSLGFIVCLVSHLLTPFVLPFIIKHTAGTLITIDLFGLFKTLILCICLPIVIYFVSHRFKLINDFSTKYNKLISIILIASIGTLAVGVQRPFLIEKLNELPITILYCSLAFFVQFSYAWLTEFKESREDRITYTIASGFNNTGIGIGLALLYFPSEIVLFMICTEVPWGVAPMLFSAFLKRR